ncbi:MAG: diacylglycerol kinase family protein [Candidatus Nanopelagicales bacterium]
MINIALIYNIHAGRKFNSKRFSQIRQNLDREAAVDYYKIKTPNDLIVHKKTLQEKYQLIVILGGDGTINGIVNLIYPSAVPFLFLPFGSGNDISKACKHNIKPFKINSILKKIKTKQMDLIQIQGEMTSYCLTVACVGTDALVSARASRMPRFIARQRYVLATIIEIILHKSIRVKASSAEHSFSGGISVCSVANTSIYGGGIKISPKSNPFDNRLELIYVTSLSRIRLIVLFMLLLLGLHTLSRKIQITPVSVLELDKVDLAVEIWGDGQKLGALPLRISKAQHPINVVVVNE